MKKFLSLAALTIAVVLGYPTAQGVLTPRPYQESRVLPLPPRPALAMTGSEFIARTAMLTEDQREDEIFRQITLGNVPSFLRKLKPVTIEVDQGRFAGHLSTVWVTPDYLAIGSDEDYIRIPMTFTTARRVAHLLGVVLPTKQIVDAIYQQADCKLSPEPLKAGRDMRSNFYYARHNFKIKKATKDRPNCEPGHLIAGHKKDVILSQLLDFRTSKEVIYGWHMPNGEPIQPVSTFHPANYADYSHGIRLVSPTAQIDGETHPLYEIASEFRTAAKRLF